MKKQKTPEPSPEYVAIKGGWIRVSHPPRRRGRPSKRSFNLELSLRHDRGVFRTVLIKDRNQLFWGADLWCEGLETLCPEGGLPSR